MDPLWRFILHTRTIEIRHIPQLYAGYQLIDLKQRYLRDNPTRNQQPILRLLLTLLLHLPLNSLPERPSLSGRQYTYTERPTILPQMTFKRQEV